MKADRKSLRGYLLVFAAGLLWGTIGLFVKEMAIRGAEELRISFLRVSFAFLVMLVVTLIRGGIGIFRISRKQILYSALLGIVCQGIYNIFYSYAVTLSGVTVSAVLLCIAPVVTLLVSMKVFSEKLTLCKGLAVLCNVIGCTLTATGGNFSMAAFSLVGILCGVGAGVSYAMTAIFGRLANDNTDVFVSSTYSYFFAALLLLIPGKPWTITLDSNTMEILFIGLLLAMIPTAFAYILYYRGVSLIQETSKVPVVASGETVVAAILGVMVYKESMNGVSLLGIILVLSSILLMNTKQVSVHEDGRK